MLRRRSFVAFSTGPGQTATDNPNGRNSWFTEALADYISQSGAHGGTQRGVHPRQEARFRRDRRPPDAVDDSSNLTSQLLLPPAPEPATPTRDSTLAEKWMEDARVREQREEWGDAIDLVNQVLQRKPGGALETMPERNCPTWRLAAAPRPASMRAITRPRPAFTNRL